jgi:hypothetical protein
VRRYIAEVIAGALLFALGMAVGVRRPTGPAMTDDELADEMCPNCVTPWKCNGPHWAEDEPLRFDDEGTLLPASDPYLEDLIR